MFGSPSIKHHLVSLLMALELRWLSLLCHSQLKSLLLLTTKQTLGLAESHTTTYMFFFLLAEITVSPFSSPIMLQLSLENSTLQPLSQNWLVLRRLNFNHSTYETSLIVSPFLWTSSIPLVYPTCLATKQNSRTIHFSVVAQIWFVTSHVPWAITIYVPNDPVILK